MPKLAKDLTALTLLIGATAAFLALHAYFLVQ